MTGDAAGLPNHLCGDLDSGRVQTGIRALRTGE